VKFDPRDDWNMADGKLALSFEALDGIIPTATE
jgi:hypothetical protein